MRLYALCSDRVGTRFADDFVQIELVPEYRIQIATKFLMILSRRVGKIGTALWSEIQIATKFLCIVLRYLLFPM